MRRTGIAILRSGIRLSTVAAVVLVLLALAACGDDETTSDELPADTGSDPAAAATPTPGAEPTATPTVEPTASQEETPEPESTATPTAEPEPAESVDLAPELVGLTEWRNTDPLSLEDLRGEPVVLVFWNSI